MPEILSWPRENAGEVLARAASQLEGDQLVVLPTDTVYTLVAHGLRPRGVARLRHLVGEAGFLALALAAPVEVKDWLPNLPSLGWRLARHAWPGPLTLVSDAGMEAGLVQRLPPEVRQTILVEGKVPLRTPDHVAIGQLMRHLAAPLVLAELPELVKPADVSRLLGDQALLVIEDGPSYFGQPSSVIRTEGRSWSLLREGVISREFLAELALCRILFVCTGNTCRSPMAMALCRKLLAERLGCAPEALRSHGFEIQSAGVAATEGEDASPDAVSVVRRLGGELNQHRSQPLTAELVARADLLFTMTRSHLRLLRGLPYPLGLVPQMLSLQGLDVLDPIGCGPEVYQYCGQQMQAFLEERLAEMLES